MHHYLRPMRRFLGSLPLIALLAGCAEEAPPALTSLPSGEQIILGASLPDTPDAPGFYLVDPASGSVNPWQLQGGRGLTENGSSGIARTDQQQWEAERRELIYSGSLGNTSGLYRITTDGAVTQATLAELPRGEADPWPRGPINAPNGETVAVVGSIYGKPGTGSEERIYLSAEDGTWDTYGAGMGFESIDFLRWAHDGHALAFFGGTRTDGIWRYQAYRIELEDGTVQLLSADEALSNSPPAFTPDGAVVFAAADAPDATPGIYVAEPGAEAERLIDLTILPEPLIWDPGLVLSPNGRFVAFSGPRDNPTTPETMYLADLTTGEVRDLLPVDQPVAQTGASGAIPEIAVLTWSPDSQRILAKADFESECEIMPVSRAVSCNRMLYTLRVTGGSLSRMSDMQFTGVRFALWVE